MRGTRAPALLLALLLLTPPARAADGPLTRAEARDRLLAAAGDYNPGVTAAALCPDGEADCRADRIVTRAEGLTMLGRAFGPLPALAGDSARRAYPAEEFTDLPADAEPALRDVLSAGIVAGVAPGRLAPDAPMTGAQLETLLRRVYALEGSNCKDDFYAAVNRTWLRQAALPAGCAGTGTLQEMARRADEQVAELLRDVAQGDPAAGTGEAAVRALYLTILDTDGRNAAGIAPLRPWLDAIDAADSLDALLEVRNEISRETGVGLLLDFGLTADLKDSARHRLTFAALSPGPEARDAREDPAARAAYQAYLTALLRLAGDAGAEAGAQACLELETALAGKAMPLRDRGDVDRIYNLYTLDELQALFPRVDLRAALDAAGFAPADAVLVRDPVLLGAAAAWFTEENLPLLRTFLKVSLLAAFGETLSEAFTDAAAAFRAARYGAAGAPPLEEAAARQVQAYLPDALGALYARRCCAAQTRCDAAALAERLRAVYRGRIARLTWMSDATKAKAIEKLDAMTVHAGYPDRWDDTAARAGLKTPAEGGSYFENVCALRRAARAKAAAAQNRPVDKDRWSIAVYTVNACYDPTANSIYLPAAILQPPLYDARADDTENLGGIGYVIAHEMTHALDDSGARFDARGNAADWWTPEDYAAFRRRCDDVAAFYDGVEAIPGVVCDGALTRSENVADLGAVACITEAERGAARPDFRTLYETAARTWRGTATRALQRHLAAADVHAPDKLRGSRALQSCDEFYEAFDIRPGDGMYLPKEQRVQVW